MGLFNASMEFFLCILNVAVIAYGGLLIMQERMTYIDLITFSLYISTFISPIRKLANFAEMFSNGFAGLQRFIELMATEPTIQDAPDAAGLPHPRGEVGIHHVRFAYPDSPEVLHDIDLTVAPGETVALVGPSGGGKSTLCQLVPRFYDVSSGSITLDGLDVRRIRQREVRGTVSSLRLDSVLSSGFSIRRQKAADAVTAGRVEVNWLSCAKPDRAVTEGDVLTVRGLGKCKLTAVGGPTKKGRLPVTLIRYL